jgi:hypothetical protein
MPITEKRSTGDRQRLRKADAIASVDVPQLFLPFQLHRNLWIECFAFSTLPKSTIRTPWDGKRNVSPRPAYITPQPVLRQPRDAPTGFPSTNERALGPGRHDGDKETRPTSLMDETRL